MDGFTVNLFKLTGDQSSYDAFQYAIGKKIAEMTLHETNELIIKFHGANGIVIWDDGQSCCEHRYMRTDDDLSYFVGAVLEGAEIKDAPSVPTEDDYGEHEVQFLEIQTDKGCITFSSHNEHNGYYGGFHIACRVND